MRLADLHVHSRFSDHPSEWFLKRIGTRESYTSVEEVYRLAKKKGMHFVTLTDHNTIEGAKVLHEQHPGDTFVSVEATTYFPEDGCKIHVLIFGIDQAQFAEIERVRDNIYELRDYLMQQDLACSVAHPTYSINGKLNLGHLEKLVLLFNVFEGINGSRPMSSNCTWMEALEDLTPEVIRGLRDTYPIEPWGDAPWMKSFTAGSDDHAGLFIGATATRSEALTVESYLRSIVNRQVVVQGRHNDYKGLAFSLYKIAWEFTKYKQPSNKAGNDLLSTISGLIFERKPLGAKNWFSLQQLKLRKNNKTRVLGRFFDDLLECLGNREEITTDQMFDRIYGNVSTLVDEFFTTIFSSVNVDLHNGNPVNLLKNISAAIPGLFLSAPFFSTLRHMNLNRQLLHQIADRFIGPLSSSRFEKKVLWFTDTLNEINGVSETVKCMARSACKNGHAMKLVVSVPPRELSSATPENIINLPFVYSYNPEFYASCTVRVPSLLKSLELIYQYQPDEIIISTPGPVGLMGMLAAKLMSLRSVAIYHTDFARQASLFLNDEFMTQIAESYTRWFYSLVDEIRVPTRQYIQELGERDFDRSKMKVFKRGIDTGVFNYRHSDRWRIRKERGIGDHPTLLWAGRLGKEKSLDFLVEVYREVAGVRKDVHLIVAGDGPILEDVKQQLARFPNVIFTGRVPHEELPAWYSTADMFLFPSVTDTYGMVILEAQACGLPVLVTDVGGPQELVAHRQTGMVLQASDRGAWTNAILELIAMMEHEPERYLEMRFFAQRNTEKQASWDDALLDLIGNPPNRQPFLARDVSPCQAPVL